MQTGFLNLQHILQGQGSEYLDFEEPPFFDDDDEDDDSGNIETDLFSTLFEEIEGDDRLGPDMPSSLASLADKLLKTKLDPFNKEKYEKYPRPKNVEFLQTPQINKPVWDHLSNIAKSSHSA